MTYNAFNKLTGRTMQTYGLGELDYDVNNQYSTKSYDSAGNVVTATTSGPNLQGGSSWQTTTKNWWYDAAGRMAKFKEEGSYGPDMHVGGETIYDGDGRPAQHTELVRLNYPIGWGDWIPLDWYYIYSSVTGEKIVDIQYDGTPIGQRVYMGGTLIFDTSYQGPFAISNGTQPYTAIGFKVTDPVTGSTQEMESDGSVPLDISTSTNVGNPNARNEIAGLGTSIPSTAPQNPYTPNYPRGGYAGNAEYGCVLDGLLQNSSKPCTDALRDGTGTPNPNYEVPFGFGYWREEDGPEKKPDADDGISGGHTRNTFISFGYLGNTNVHSGQDRNEPQKSPCVFNINLKVPKNWEKTDTETMEESIPGLPPIKSTGELRRFKNNLSKIFEDAGVKVVFDDAKAASNNSQWKLQP